MNIINVRRITREDLVKYLSENEGTVYRTAQKLGVTRSAVIRVLVLEAITGKVPIPEINKAKEVTPQP